MARESNSRARQGEVMGIHIKPMGDGEGVISSTERRFKRGGQGGGPMHDYESEEHHHPTPDSLIDHLKEALPKAFAPAEIQEKPSGEEEE